MCSTQLFVNMETFSTFTNKEEFQSRLFDIVDSTSETFSKIKTGLNSDLFPVNSNSYHFIMEFLKPKNRIEAILWSMVHRDIHQAEVISGNSAKFAFVFAMEFLKELLKNQDSLPKNETELFAEFDLVLQRLKEHVQNTTTTATPKHIKETIRYFCEGNENLEVAIDKAIELAGLEGKILVENSSKQPNYVVEAKSGYCFKLNPFGFMLGNSSVKRWDRREVKMLVVDGLIEKVSEIDQILNMAHKTEQPLAIIAHGFSEEVVATCKSNNDAGRFDVIPIRMHHDLSSINIIRDIGVVCGTTPVTHLLGQLLSTVKWEELGVVDRVVVTPQNTTIECAKSHMAVLSHVKDLVARRYSSGVVEDIRNLLDERLVSLVGHSVILNLPQVNSIEEDFIRVKIDLCLRNVKTILNYGTVNITNVVEDYHIKGGIEYSLENMLINSIGNSIRYFSSESLPDLPSLSVILGILLSGKTCLRLASTTGVVELVSN
jgi:chaperonin GroEL (HSP60 family)